MKTAWVIVTLAIEIEVHMVNPHAREGFPYRSVMTPIAEGQTAGFGVHTHFLGLEAA